MRIRFECEALSRLSSSSPVEAAWLCFSKCPIESISERLTATLERRSSHSSHSLFCKLVCACPPSPFHTGSNALYTHTYICMHRYMHTLAQLPTSTSLMRAYFSQAIVHTRRLPGFLAARARLSAPPPTHMCALLHLALSSPLHLAVSGTLLGQVPRTLIVKRGRFNTVLPFFVNRQPVEGLDAENSGHFNYNDPRVQC
eukprot:5602333-Pleurochrysis_carterae.AAC.1